MSLALFLISVGLVYSLLVSYLACRQSGEKWMLFFPHWIDRRCGISKRLRRHGFIAFAILFAGTTLFLLP